MSNLYATVHLSDSQIPKYNLGNPLFGKIDLTTQFTNDTANNGMWRQDLNYPYWKVYAAGSSNPSAEKFNFETVDLYSMLNSSSTITMHSKSYMYDADSQVIVIPQSGWYKITMSASAHLDGVGTTFNATQYYNSFWSDESLTEKQVQIKRDFNHGTPLEIQLVRNYSENVELIKGSYNETYDSGDPNEETYQFKSGALIRTPMGKQAYLAYRLSTPSFAVLH